ncbi:A disintegrin and metalloproteinase with thrombospondin motifs 6 [Platysternon megacephalum]|uniref:A disintegrin and metalloproteinase with thrombospondin motifs 6 n=1 Tax=Platysternon megacephalum TaxID=55544 RepID=A0A4D9F8G1_9SAUR|nr:A disintegrin and metalloproteinase with thrombospondin motifs 6 [Platysternon megacephalum]
MCFKVHYQISFKRLFLFVANIYYFFPYFVPSKKKPKQKTTFLLAQCPYFYSSMSLFIAFKWWLIWNYAKHVGFYFNKNQDFRKLKINKNVSTNFVKNSSGKHILISSNLSLHVLAI